jgi:cytochrome c oxidase subunit 3
MIGGILFLLVVIGKALNLKVHKKNTLSLNLCVTYWHFLGAAWIYLYFFLLLNR